MSSLLDFHFIRPLWLLALIPVLLMAYVALRQQSNRPSWEKKLPKHLALALGTRDKQWRKKLPIKVWLVVSIIVIVTASGPTWKRETTPFSEDHSPLFIVLDTSESMLETDVKPNRLSRAKLKVQDLLAENSSKNTALIAYAGSAHLAVPLTQDEHVFVPILQSLSPAVMPLQGKYPELAVSVIEDQLNKMSQKAVSATIVVLSDGVGSSAKEFYAALSQRNDISIKVLILGIGDQTRTSNIPFDERGLKMFASQISGDYHRMTSDDSDIKWLSNHITNHTRLNGEQAQPWKDMGYPLVFIIMAIFLLWFRKGWTVHWCLLPLILVMHAQPVSAENTDGTRGNFVFIDLWMTKDQQAQWYFNRGDYQKAAELFVSTEHKAQAYYLAENFELANAYYLRVNNKQGMLGAANSAAQLREYVVARQMYKQILRQYPDFEAAKTNLLIVEKIIEDINRQSESQANTENESSKELGDAPQTSDGAEEKVAKKQVQKQKFSANQLRANKAMFDAWMKQVEGNQQAFLATKFAIQLQKKDSSNESD
ncbi:VWA domain-containing protein [Vibrio hepatarius]|uniref:vWA domain-containing protein n=1 Tax=Vibrio hepatarius TaxID=171383 RepID=UPI003736A961